MKNILNVVIDAASIVGKTAIDVSSTVGKAAINIFSSKKCHEVVDKVVETKVGEMIKPLFAGLSEETLTEMAKGTGRGIRVEVVGEKVIDYYYKSNRGRQLQCTRFILDEDGDIVRLEGMGPYALANSPKIFHEILLKALKEE